MSVSFPFTCGKYKFILDINGILTALCIVFILLFIGCGHWQMCRYDYKKDLIKMYESNTKSLPIDFTADHLKRKINLFQSIKMQGIYLNDLTVLIMNRLHEGHLGFEVITPFKIQGADQLILIDRGWIPVTVENKPPAIVPISGTHTVRGYIYPIQSLPFILGKNIAEPLNRPLVIQTLQLSDLSHTLNHSFFPYLIRLAKTEANGFLREWIISTVPPERHLGYAIQWYLFAVTTFILWACFSIRRVNK